MSDSLEPNISAPAPKTKISARRGSSSTKRSKQRRPALPGWAPWALIGGFLVAGVIGSRVGRAAIGSSSAAKAPGDVNPSAAAGPSPLPNTSASAASAPSARAANESEPTISVQYLVVTHSESIMGRTLKVKRTREQAKERAAEALARARKGDDFATLVAEYSDDAHKSEFHGELLNFARKHALPSFSAAAFNLKVGEISDIVETPYGYDVIRRIK